MFAALFFVSIGALMDVSLLPLFMIPALILIGVSLGAKFMTVYLAAKSQDFNKLTSLRAGIGLSFLEENLHWLLQKVVLM
jgi:K+:H+ antiporter